MKDLRKERLGLLQHVREGVLVGAVLAVLSGISWVLVVSVRSPESTRFLELIRERDASGNWAWDTRACYHCPAFVLLNRGFGSDKEPLAVMALVLTSIPAIRVAKDGAPNPRFPISALSGSRQHSWSNGS